MNGQQDKQQAKNRRRALKAITAASGGIVVTKWSKPIVDKVVLPAHAETTVVDQPVQDSEPTINLVPGGGYKLATMTVAILPD